MFHQPIARHRLFFAIRPPRVRARQLASAAHWFETEGRAVDAERLHITSFLLDDLDRLPDELVARLHGVGDGLSLAPFDVMLDRAVGSDQSIALRPSRRNDGLAELHRQLAANAHAAGIPERDKYRFSPHLTLGYRNGASFQQPIAPVGWRAEEVVLIHSHLGQTRHDLIGRWSLRAAPAPQGSLF